jgi:hypothetical protein
MPGRQILSLPRLRIIFWLLSDIPHFGERLRCYLLRNHSTTFSEFHSQRVDQNNSLAALNHSCFQLLLLIRNTSFWDVIAGSKYDHRCEVFLPVKPVNYFATQQKLKTPNIDSGLYLVSMEHQCWKTINKIQILTLCVGLLTMVFNLIVVITTLRSRVLRESVAHVLVGNIAVADLLVSFYLIIITTTRQSTSSADEFSYFHLPNYCRVVGICFLLGQISSSFMSFVMTLERYLAVVYCMKPHIRITMRMCYVAMVMVWSVSVSLAVSFMTSPQFSISTDRMCVPLNNIDGTQVLIYIGGLGVVSYLISMALYGHIYINVKRTNEKSVQLQRESHLARRIAMVTLTNVFFFMLPFSAILIVDMEQLRPYITDNSRYIFWQVCGATCLGFNSCLNPMLFSFRNEKFRNGFRKRCFLYRNAISTEP